MAKHPISSTQGDYSILNIMYVKKEKNEKKKKKWQSQLEIYNITLQMQSRFLI